MSQHLRLSYCS